MSVLPISVKYCRSAMSVVLSHCLVLSSVVFVSFVCEGFGTYVCSAVKIHPVQAVFLTSRLFLRIWHPTHMEPQTASNNLATT